MTEVMQVREAYRVEQWRQLMQQRKDSPLNNREFCAQQGISEKSYYYWLKNFDYPEKPLKYKHIRRISD